MDYIKQYELSLKETARCEVTRSHIVYTAFDVVEILNQICPLTNKLCEEILVITLTPHNRINSVSSIAKGTATNCKLSPEVIFSEILLSGCTKYIIVHNHTYGTAIPSKEDRHFTQEYKMKSKMLGLELYDHIIVSRYNIYSFRAESLLAADSKAKIKF